MKLTGILFIAEGGAVRCEIDGTVYGEGHSTSIENVVTPIAAALPHHAEIAFRWRLGDGSLSARIFHRPSTIGGWLEVMRLRTMTREEREEYMATREMRGAYA